jgi:hypothetical protein
MLINRMPISHIKRFRRYLAFAVLLYAVAAVHAARQKGATQSPSVAAATASGSDSSPVEIAPGIPLPPKGIVWIFDKAEEKQVLVRVSLNNASFNRHVGENAARTQFFLKGVATLELPDAAAKMRLSSRTPVIYVHRSVEEEDELPSAATGVVKGHYVLLRTRVVGGRRVIYGFSESPLFGKFNRQKEEEVEVISEEIARGQWLKLTPKQPLPDGEYAVNKLPDDKKIGETFVYDFGIGALPTQPPQK